MSDKRRIADVENLSDFAQYYNNTYIDGPTGPVHVSVSDALYLRRLSPGGRLGPLVATTFGAIKESYSFGRPSLGLVELAEGILYVSVAGLRQSHKGLLPTNLVCTEFPTVDWRSDETTVARLGGSENDGRVVYQLFRPTYRTFAEAQAQLMAGTRVGCAINRHVGLIVMPNVSRSVVTYKKWDVGYVEDDVVKLMEPYHDYKEPIRKAVSVKVECIT